MSVASVTDLLRRAAEQGYAVGYFESWNLESLQGVLDAAEGTRSPILIGFNGEFLTHAGRLAREAVRFYARLCRAAAETAAVPCGLVFNECRSAAAIREAVDAGFGQVMLEGSSEMSESDFVREAAALSGYAHERGVAFEIEAGELPNGQESGGRGGELTDPERAARLVKATGADILAVSVGNVHVLTDGPRALDIKRLERVRAAVGSEVALDLHGGTGIDRDSLREAIRRGVAKVCYGTYVKQRYLAALRSALGASEKEKDPHELLGMGGPQDLLVIGRRAVRDAVLERIEDLGGCGKA